MKGLDRAGIRLAQISSRAAAEAERTLKECGEMALEAARRNAPVQTGALRAAISLQCSPVSAIVKTGCPYAGAVEWGGRFTPARPFLAPAAGEADYFARMQRALKECMR